MKEKLPKPMRDALGRETAPADHPSSDLLAAFIEHALGKSETRSLADHLAGCAECRAVVFSASGATEEPMGAEDLQESPATRGWRTIAHAATESTAANRKPKRRRTWRWVWAAPAGVMFLLVGGYFAHRYFAPVPLTSQLASNATMEKLPTPGQPPQNVNPPGVPPASPAPVPTPKSRSEAKPGSGALAKKIPTGSTDSLEISSEGASAAKTEELHAKSEMPKPASEPSTIAVGEPPPAAAPTAPHANGFVPSTGANVQSYSYTSNQLSAQRAAVDALQPLHPGWRVTALGYLEHRTSEGWTRVLADRAAAFRAVTVVGDNVWAGGSEGALFHSQDAGLHWKKVSLPESNDAPPAIVSIHFDDQQRGVVSTDKGSRWSTNDGGTTWSRQ